MSFRRRGKTIRAEDIPKMMTELMLDPEAKVTFEQFEDIMNDILTK